MFQPEDARPDLEIRWFEFADWLEIELPALEEVGEVASFLAQQFLDFLEARRMTLAQVGKYMPDGVRALANLMNMLNEAAAACKVSVKRVFGKDYIGVNLDGVKYRVAVDFSDPEQLWFGTRCRVDAEGAGKLGWVSAGDGWWWEGVELDSESVHFFSRSKVSQMEWLEGFLRECLTRARSIEMPDQPPISEEPEEGN